MSRELDHFRRHAELLIHHNAGSRASREAAKRSFQRGVRSFLVRIRRAGFTLAGLMSVLVVYMMTYGADLVPFLLAVAAIMFLSFMMLFLPVRDRRRAPEEWHERPAVERRKAQRLDRLTVQTEEWLLDRCRALPQQAAPALDRIIDRLRDLAPSLASVSTETPLGGEAQRLIGQHLPGLVATYLTLPPAERSFHAETSRQLADSLAIVADQMDDLCERVATERRLGFDTERRFIESRYRDGSDLSVGRPY